MKQVSDIEVTNGFEECRARDTLQAITVIAIEPHMSSETCDKSSECAHSRALIQHNSLDTGYIEVEGGTSAPGSNQDHSTSFSTSTSETSLASSAVYTHSPIFSIMYVTAYSTALPLKFSNFDPQTPDLFGVTGRIPIGATSSQVANSIQQITELGTNVL